MLSYGASVKGAMQHGSAVPCAVIYASRSGRLQARHGSSVVRRSTILSRGLSAPAPRNLTPCALGSTLRLGNEGFGLVAIRAVVNALFGPCQQLVSLFTMAKAEYQTLEVNLGYSNAGGEIDHSG